MIKRVKRPKSRLYVRNAPNWDEIAHSEMRGSSRTEYLATFINPVDKRLYNAVISGHVYIVESLPVGKYSDSAETVRYFAEGYYDSHDEKELEYEDDTGTYYRSHSPGGVAVKGKGYGYLLYSALSLAATASNRYAAGVFSENKTRSSDATRWWNAQVRQGYAEETNVSSADYASISVDVEQEIRDNLGSYIEAGYFEGVDPYGDIEIYEISPENVDVEVTVEASVEVQYLPAKKVAAEGLVIGWASDNEKLDTVFEDARFPSVEVLSELNLDTVRDIEEVKLIWKLIDDDPDATDAQRERILHSLDLDFFKEHQHELVDMVGKQLKLPLVANKRRTKPTYSKAWKEYFGDLAVIDPEVM